MSDTSVVAIRMLLLQIGFSALLALVLFSAAPKLQGWKRVAAFAFGVLSIIGIVVSVIFLLILLTFAGFT